MLIRHGCEITVNCMQDTPLVCMLTARPELDPSLRGTSTMATVPQEPISIYVDLFGNRCRRLVAPAGDLTIWNDATMEVAREADRVFPQAREIPVAELPDECLVYLMGSRYCQTDLMSQAAWDMFGGVAPGWNRVQTICDFVHQHIRFDYQQARATRSAYEAHAEAVGVCRDYAHLALTICRCLNIPARYVNGYLGDFGVPAVEPMDFAAWIEVYLEGGWHTFDPRNNIPRIGRIVVARGRDAADVPLINSFGPHILKSFRVWAYEVDTAA